MEDSWRALTLSEQDGSLRGVFPTKERPHRTYYIPDLHYPYQNNDVIGYIQDAALGADEIHFIGDDVDADSIMKHTRNPERTSTLKEQAREFELSMLKPIRKQNPHIPIFKHLGNHEERLDRLIWNKVPELWGLDGLTWRNILHADEYDVQIVGREGILRGGRRVKHGDKAIKGAGNSARGEMLEHRIDGVSGHTHRYAVIQYTDKEGRTTRWAEIGHAMNLSLGADYVKGEPDWCLSGGLEILRWADGREKWIEHRLQ